MSYSIIDSVKVNSQILFRMSGVIKCLVVLSYRIPFDFSFFFSSWMTDEGS